MAKNIGSLGLQGIISSEMRAIEQAVEARERHRQRDTTPPASGVETVKNVFLRPETRITRNELNAMTGTIGAIFTAGAERVHRGRPSFTAEGLFDSESAASTFVKNTFFSATSRSRKEAAARTAS